MLVCTTSSFAGLSQKSFEYRYYDLLTVYTRAKSNSDGVYRYLDGRDVNPEARFKTQAERDCITWRAARDYAAYVIENFDQYEAAVKNNTPFFDNISRREWEVALKETNRKLHNPKNECN